MRVVKKRGWQLGKGREVENLGGRHLENTMLKEKMF